MTLVRSSVAVLTLVAVTGAASAQSLGEIARREQERRQAAPPAGKVYTGETLRPAPPPASAPVASADQPAAVPPSPSGVQPEAKEEPPPEEPKRDEKYWRDRMQSERSALQRA